MSTLNEAALAVVSEIEQLRAERDALKAELATTRARLAELEEPRLRALHMESGEIEMSIEESTGLVHRMALAMTTMFESAGAKNYVHQVMHLEAKGYELVVRPLHCPTAHDLRVKAEADLAQLRAEAAAAAESSLAVIEAQGQEVTRLQLEVKAGEEALLEERRASAARVAELEDTVRVLSDKNAELQVQAAALEGIEIVESERQGSAVPR